MSQQIKFFIARPTKTRHVFCLVAYQLGKAGERVYLKSSDPKLIRVKERTQAINQLYRSNLISSDEAERRLWALIEDEHGRTSDDDDGINLSNPNKTAFLEFWQIKYSRRENKDMDSARHDFLRALRIIDPSPLLKSRPEKLDRIIIEACGRDSTKRRRTAIKLNEMLAFFGSRERLIVNREPRKPIKHLTREEVIKLSKAGDEDMRLATITLFATGCRVGEALDLGSGKVDHRNFKIYVQSQKSLRTNDFDEPKRGSVGWVFVVPEFWDDVISFINIPNKDRRFYERLYKFVTRESRKLWPDNRVKNISVHDLRHSHAIYLLDKGATLNWVAQNLRNSIFTCQKYYTGYCHTEGTTDHLKGLFT